MSIRFSLAAKFMILACVFSAAIGATKPGKNKQEKDVSANSGLKSGLVPLCRAGDTAALADGNPNIFYVRKQETISHGDVRIGESIYFQANSSGNFLVVVDEKQNRRVVLAGNEINSGTLAWTVESISKSKGVVGLLDGMHIRLMTSGDHYYLTVQNTRNVVADSKVPTTTFTLNKVGSGSCDAQIRYDDGIAIRAVNPFGGKAARDQWLVASKSASITAGDPPDSLHWECRGSIVSSVGQENEIVGYGATRESAIKDARGDCQKRKLLDNKSCDNVKPKNDWQCGEVQL